LDGAEAAGILRGASLYVCGVKKLTQLITQRADGSLPVSLKPFVRLCFLSYSRFRGKAFADSELFRF